MSVMKEVDKTITTICKWINNELTNEYGVESDKVAEMTKALAELISARAKHN